MLRSSTGTFNAADPPDPAYQWAARQYHLVRYATESRMQTDAGGRLYLERQCPKCYLDHFREVQHPLTYSRYHMLAAFSTRVCADALWLEDLQRCLCHETLWTGPGCAHTHVCLVCDILAVHICLECAELLLANAAFPPPFCAAWSNASCSQRCLACQVQHMGLSIDDKHI